MTAPRFTWDEDKNLSNQRKHGVSFELAARVFLDPLHLSVQDRVENGEQRWQTLGLIGGVAVVLVAHTFTEDGATDEPVEMIRIISAESALRASGRFRVSTAVVPCMARVRAVIDRSVATGSNKINRCMSGVHAPAHCEALGAIGCTPM